MTVDDDERTSVEAEWKQVRDLDLYRSPTRLLLYLLISVAIVESITQAFHTYVPEYSRFLAALFHIALTTALVYPALYFFMLRPLTAHIAGRRRVEKALQKSHDELELRVLERTQRLAAVNQALSKEVNERRQAEGQVRLLTTALDAAANGIFITDRDGVIKWCNPAFLKMTGFTAEEVIGKSPRMIRSEQQDDYFYRDLWDTILAGRVWRGELINRRRDGSQYPEEETITPVLDENGEISHFIAIKQDITERKKWEDELKQRNLELVALHTISAAVSRTLDLGAILDILRLSLSDELGFPAGVIYLEQDNGFLQASSWGFPKVFSAGPSEITILPLHFLQVLAGRDVFIDARMPGEMSCGFQARWYSEKGYVCIPLLAGNQTQGIIELFGHAQVEFSDLNSGFFRALGNQVGVAIQNARLYDAEQQARDLAEALSDASLALTGSLDLDTVICTLIEFLRRLVPCDYANVLLLEDEAHLKARCSFGYPSDSPVQQGVSFSLETGQNPAVAELLAQGKSLRIADTHARPGWTWRLGVTTRSWLGIPLMAGQKAIGLCSLEARQPGVFTDEQVHQAEALVVQGGVALQNAWLFEQVRAGHERLQALSRRLVEVQENERRYIARELHDEAGQALASLAVGLELLQRSAGDPEAVQRGVQEMERTVDQVLESLHRMAMDLRPASLDHLGLVSTLEQHLKNIAEKHQLQVKFEALHFNDRLSQETETALYRILQEAVTNIVRHSQATSIDVILEQRRNRLILLVEDNGIGFEPLAPRAGEHLGMFGMRERAEMLDGHLIVESTPGRGTTLIVDIPLTPQNLKPSTIPANGNKKPTKENA